MPNQQRYSIETREDGSLRIVGPQCVTRWYGPEDRVAVHHACERANEVGAARIIKELHGDNDSVQAKARVA